MALTQYRMDSALARLFRKRAGAYVRGLRTDAKMTQQQVAKRLGLEYYTMVSAVEQGYSRVPSEALEQWANALGVRPADFARNLLEWYDPFMYRALFGGPDPVAKVYGEGRRRGTKGPVG